MAKKKRARGKLQEPVQRPPVPAQSLDEVRLRSITLTLDPNTNIFHCTAIGELGQADGDDFKPGVPAVPVESEFLVPPDETTVLEAADLVFERLAEFVAKSPVSQDPRPQ